MNESPFIQHHRHPGTWVRYCAYAICVAFLVFLSIDPPLAGGERETNGFGFGQSAGGDSAGRAVGLPDDENGSRPVVTVDHFAKTSVPVEISLFGVTEARYRQKLTAGVEGRIAFLSPSLDPGMALKKGDEVAAIEDSSYLAALANAERALAEAELSLLQEEQRSKQASADWERAQVQDVEPSALTLREPFLRLERRKLEAAKASLAEAQRDLANTRVVMPFDAVVISRTSTPAAYVTRGAEIAEIYATDELAIEVGLTEQQRRLLLRDEGKFLPLNTLSAEIRDDAGDVWQARVVSEGAVADAATRQRSLRLAIDPRNEGGALLKPGVFVRVTLAGRSIENTLVLPASAISLRGHLWAVSEFNGEHQLERFAVAPLLTQGGNVAIDASQLPEKDEWDILLNPVNRYLPGQLVNLKGVRE